MAPTLGPLPPAYAQPHHSSQGPMPEDLEVPGVALERDAGSGLGQAEAGSHSPLKSAVQCWP